MVVEKDSELIDAVDDLVLIKDVVIVLDDAGAALRADRPELRSLLAGLLA